MVATDIRYNRERRSQDVGGIEAAPEAGFYDGDVNLLPGEVVERKGGRQLKERDFFFTRMRRWRSTKLMIARLVIGSPLTRARSRNVTRWGEVNRPTLYPAWRRTASSIAAVEPLPLVPAI